MRIPCINYSNFTKNCLSNTKTNSNFTTDTVNSNSAYALTPYQMPIIFCGKKIKPTDNPNYNFIIEHGYEPYSDTKIKDEDGNIEKAHIFVKKCIDEDDDTQYRHVIITNSQYMYLGAIKGYTAKQKDGEKYIYLSLINNFTNTHDESSCDSSSHDLDEEYSKQCQTRYKRVGRNLCKAFENIIKKDFPEVKYIECCPVRYGSTMFFEQMGYKWHHTDDVYSFDLRNSEDDEEHYHYYRKYL